MAAYFPKGFFPPGYWADGYWPDDYTAPGTVVGQGVGTLAGLSGTARGRFVEDGGGAWLLWPRSWLVAAGLESMLPPEPVKVVVPPAVSGAGAGSLPAAVSAGRGAAYPPAVEGAAVAVLGGLAGVANGVRGAAGSAAAALFVRGAATGQRGQTGAANGVLAVPLGAGRTAHGVSGVGQNAGHFAPVGKAAGFWAACTEEELLELLALVRAAGSFAPAPPAYFSTEPAPITQEELEELALIVIAARAEETRGHTPRSRP